MPVKPVKNKKSFVENYEVLQHAVSQLQDDENISVDELLPLVDQATAAYEQCRQSLESIEEALEKRFVQE